MESFENLPDPDAGWQSGPQGPDRRPASGKVAIWAPAIGAVGSRSPPCLCDDGVSAGIWVINKGPKSGGSSIACFKLWGRLSL